jgi:FAD/FMN-containing dehydrogenase
MSAQGERTATIPELAGFEGERIEPADPAYDEARTVFPGGFDRRPAAVFRPESAEEVSQVIGLARGTGLPLAVRGGGHSGAGWGVVDDGIVLDVRNLDDLDIDASERFAWTGTGVTTGAYTQAAWEHRLATGFGDAGTVGIGGITLSGGVGFLARKHGMTIDSLLAAEIVTAGGEVLTVDTSTHPELFWAIRGGGGNFGVVTRLKLRLHEVSSLYGGTLILPATPETIGGLVAAADSAPEELSAIANVMPAPPMPFVPPEHHGERVVMAQIAHVGPVEAGERAVAPFRELAEPIADMVAETDLPELFPPLEEDYHPVVDFRTGFADDLSVDAAERIVAALDDRPSAMAAIQIRVLGGAMRRVAPAETAFAHRDRKVMLNVVAMYAPGDEPGSSLDWVEELAGQIMSAPGAYAGFLGDEGLERVRAAYPPETWERLADVKLRYDPTNLFRLNQNVPPAPSGRGDGARTG